MNAASGAAVLTSRGWLAEMPEDFQRALLGQCAWRRFASGEAMFRAGTRGGGLYGLASGVALIEPTFSAPDIPPVHFAQPGFWFGYVPMIAGNEGAITTTAKTETLVSVTTGAQVERMIAARPDWWRCIAALGILYGNLAATGMVDLMIRDSRRRCTAVLLRLAGCRHEDPIEHPAEAPVSQSELAAIANLSRASTNAILRALEEAGQVELGYGSVLLRDVGALRAMVDNPD